MVSRPAPTRMHETVEDKSVALHSARDLRPRYMKVLPAHLRSRKESVRNVVGDTLYVIGCAFFRDSVQRS